MEQLQAYTTQMVALGQATLARHRRGEWLPEELAAQAAALLALESELGINPSAAPGARSTAPGVTAILDQTVAPPPQPPPVAAAEPPASVVAAMSPIEADNWLSALDDEVSNELLILDLADAAPADEPLVIDVDEGPGGVAGALPPLVIDPIHDLSPDSGPFQAPGEPPPAAEPSSCTNCGATLRPGRRFCHQCGAPVAEPAADPWPVTAVPPQFAPPPAPVLPSDEWPTIVSSSPYAGLGHAPARLCHNCGRRVAAGVTVCPDCGSEDLV